MASTTILAEICSELAPSKQPVTGDSRRWKTKELPNALIEFVIARGIDDQAE